MPNIIRIINLQLDTDLSGATFPVDKLSYTENAKRVNILDLKNYILSGVTGATYDMSKYLAISGGTLTGLLEGPHISISAPVNTASADLWTDNYADTYGVNIIGSAVTGEDRLLIRVGRAEFNGFTIDWKDVNNRFFYEFGSGDIVVDGNISGYTFVKIGSIPDQTLMADGNTLTLTGGTYFPVLINTSNISNSLLTHAVYSMVGDVTHVKISGYLTPSGIFPKLQLELPTTCSMPVGVKVGIGTLWNWSSGSTMTGYIEVGATNTVYFYANLSGTALTGITCDFVTEFDYSLTGGITTTTTTTLTPTTTTTTTLSGTTTTTTSSTTLTSLSNIQVTNNGVGGDSIIAVSVNSIPIVDAYFPVYFGGDSFGTTNQIGGYTIDVSYNIVAGGYRVRFYNNSSLVDCQNISSSGVGNVTSIPITISNGDNLQIKLEAVTCEN